MSYSKSIGKMVMKLCNRCGNKVKLELHFGLRFKDGYKYYCPYCDENMYSFEVHKEKKGGTK